MSVDSFNQDAWPIKWWWALSFSVSTYLVIIIFNGLLSSYIDLETTLARGLIYIISSIALLLFSRLFLIKLKVGWGAFLGRVSIKQIAFTPFYFIGYVALSRVAQALIDPIPGVDIEQSQDLGVNPQGPTQLIVIFLSLVILPALAEEVLFRGLLYRSFKKKFGIIVSAVIISGLFGLAHGQWNVAVDTFILSLVLVTIVEKTGSLWPAIALHFLKNLVAFLMVFVFNGA